MRNPVWDLVMKRVNVKAAMLVLLLAGGCDLLLNQFDERIRFSVSNAPEGVVGEPYRFQITANIKNEPQDELFDYRFRFEDGTLPPGTDFTTNRELGNDFALVSGTPTVAGEYTFAVRVRSERLGQQEERDEEEDAFSRIKSEREGYFTILIRE